ncbi:MlaD family protein [Nocardia sp. CDC159]|uniref:MlaD family protein n=1 Tax=Nocardia pulmonis TaxID=2951408 RepID=A0A9X2IW81_9NOCA|nr:MULTISPECIES: MlaD family protein [Nocardia]MCM6774008.1 MlaD family protein [Nocardia pulmonis]MCM6786895.1 MlaD family protein [Nocardia sp. CDC159]
MTTFQDLSGRSAGPLALFVRGALALLAVAIAATAVRYATTHRSGAAELRVVTVTSADTSGVNVGSPVLLRGTHIGTVTAIAQGSASQRIVLSLATSAANLLTDAATTRIAATNLFGAAGVEIVPGDRPGHRLTPGTLLAGQQQVDRSLIDVLRRFGRMLGMVDLGTLTDLGYNNADTAITGAADGIRLATVLTDLMLPPGADARTYFPIRDGSVTLEAAAPLAPAVLALARSLLDHSDALVTHRAGLSAALSGVSDLFSSVGRLLGDDPHLVRELSTAFDTISGPAWPVVVSLGSLPIAYSQAGQMISRIDRAIPIRDGKPVLQVDIASQLPFLTASATGGASR